MTTVYTVNNKVLKNSATDKWLKKPDAPAGFVMNASNATYGSSGSTAYVRWQSPSYPDAYNGNGKQYILVNNNSEAAAGTQQLMYGQDSSSSHGGPTIISASAMQTLGTSTGVLENNVAYPAYGATIDWAFYNTTIEQLQAYVANLTITILDP